VLDACAVKDRRPKAAIGVTVVEQFMHCAKAFRRSELWNADVWPDRPRCRRWAASSRTRSPTWETSRRPPSTHRWKRATPRPCGRSAASVTDATRQPGAMCSGRRRG
jgi:hypothetical protein